MVQYNYNYYYSVRFLRMVIGKSERVGESSSERHLTFTKASWRIQKILLWVGVGGGWSKSKTFHGRGMGDIFSGTIHWLRKKTLFVKWQTSVASRIVTSACLWLIVIGSYM